VIATADLTAVSLFAGIEGFGLALERSGVDVVASVEINEECRGVIARHFPQAKLFNDVTEVTGDQLRAAGFVPERGIITGGFPCQDLSVAGRRAGLGGARSGLFWQIMRLADELRPRWLVLENVPGLLSAVCPCPGDEACVANGRAVRCGEWRGDREHREWFPRVPHQVTGGACPGGCMPAHGGAMGTVLGAVGKRGYGFAYRVLDAQFFGVPQRRRRVFIAGCLGDRAAPVQVLLEPESGGGHPAACRETGPGTARAPGGGAVSSLQGGGRRGHRVDAEGAAGGHLVTGTLTAGTMTEYDDNTARAGHMITHALTSREGKGPDSDATTGFITVPVAPTVRSHPRPRSADPGNVVPVALRGRESGGQIEAGRPGDPSFTLSAAGRALPGVATTAGFAENQRGEVTESAISSQLTAGGGKPGQGYPAIRQETAVRRLTPLECERLQGFPDEWTRWLADGTEQSDSARYRELGNAVAVPVTGWITRRIVAVEARLSAARGAA
jgi:DNA (cytosine-5)-methyltransferase 1